MFQNVAFQWFARRALEIGGIVGLLYQIYASLPPFAQQAISEVLSGDASPQAKATALGAVIIAAGGYVWSFRSTVQPQVVTQAGQKIVPKAGTEAQARIEVQAKAAPKAPTIFESILARLGR